jgi:hypothetical protein
MRDPEQIQPADSSGSGNSTPLVAGMIIAMRLISSDVIGSIRPVGPAFLQ